MDHNLVTTGYELPGLMVSENLGVVRGIVVRSRSVVGNLAAGIQTIFGGHISIYANLCETARQDAYDLMIEHAEEKGATGVIGMRFESNEIMGGVTEVLAYGTAVVLDHA